MSMFVSQKYRPFLPKVRREDLALLGEWIADGKVRPVIDRRYALDEVGEALRYVQQGRARGKVVIGVDDVAAHSG
jgi:NADPH:quinone reductase-like Zn-dependent oxidoreductase